MFYNRELTPFLQFSTNLETPPEAYMEKYPGEVELVVSDDLVQPSFDTIVVEGEHWIDGYERPR